MVQTGLSWVRIGEFAWSRLEPSPGDVQLDWLDRAITVLGDAGLKVILGTPTATPPRWMVEKHPDMFAVDIDGRIRGFGSRRHYCFSHAGYLDESRRITEILARRYGDHPYIAAWQTDNEYGCHDTTLSYSEAARDAFRGWLAERYGTINALNEAWGNVFWSMEYASFDQVELPNLTVTEPNPSHALAFRRFSSDQVVRFNKAQCDILRAHSKAPLIHNYMGRVTEFDHYDIGRDLDIASWDSYPLGFLEDRINRDDAHKRAYAQQGDPDFQAFHHDLYRTVGRGRWWIMEQQPGPVNWAPVNPAPLPGMCRLWAWEAFAHGAETVCYFRWRQAPFAQEQMHAGLLRSDAAPAPALDEAAQVAQELTTMPEAETAPGKVALIFDYCSDWAWQVQPQGTGFDYFDLVFETYRGLRKLGLDIDILPPDTDDLSAYGLVLAPGVFHMPEGLMQALDRYQGVAVIGPRAHAKTAELTIPTPLPPNLPGLDVTVTRSETFRADMDRNLQYGGAVRHWFDHVETSETVTERTDQGAPVLIGEGSVRYLTSWLNEEAMLRILEALCVEQNIATTRLPDGIRLKRTKSHLFVFNYAATQVHFNGVTFAPAGLHWFPR